MELLISESFRESYPEAGAGILALRGVSNPSWHADLEHQKQKLEESLRGRYAGYDRQALRLLPPLQAYHSFYRRYDKTYHLQLQLESIVFKGKSIPSTAALVECMFMAELDHLLLTAGHDWATLTEPLRLEGALGGERFTQLNGQESVLKAGDLYISDAVGILSSVLNGPDQRTAITPTTESAVFTVYAPPGILKAQVLEHLGDIQRYIRLFAPQAVTETLQFYR
jgi:DNA/RNA-binding domain of Phe-tRNA-synthetase-like protein